MAKKQDEPKSTLFELANRNGQLFVPNQKFHSVDAHESPFKATHQVADVRHGWTLHEKTVHQNVTLSDADYLSALDAAKKGKTHAPANFRSAEHEARKQANREAAKKGD